MGISFERPELLLLLPVLIGLTLVIHAAARHRLGIGRRRAALLVRSILLTVLTFGSNALNDNFSGFQPVGPEWFQYLPISIGGNVFNALPGAGGVTSSGDISSLFLRSVEFPVAMCGVLIYLVAALGIALIALRRQEIA